MANRKRKNKFLRKKPRPRKSQKKFIQFEKRLEAFHLEMLKDLQDAVVQIVVPRIERLAQTQKATTDGIPQLAFDAPGDAEALENLIDLAEAQFLGKYSRAYIRRNINQIFRDLDLAADEEVIREFAAQQIAVVQTPQTNAVVENATRTSLGKIEDLNKTTIGRIRERVSKAIVSGERWEAVGNDLKSVGAEGATFRSPEARAKFIARNEVGTALGALNKERQESAGIDLYEWQTAEDERVRTSHRKLDGRIFSWDEPPPGSPYKQAKVPNFNPVIPGQDYNCRCVAIPFIPEIDEKTDIDDRERRVALGEAL